MAKDQIIDKPTAYRIFELIQSLQVVRDSVAAIQRGRSHQMLPMAGQLRSLLIERAKPARPLLLDIAQLFEVPLTLYASPALKSEPSADFLLDMQGFFATTKRTFADQTEISLADYLSRAVVRYEGADYSAAEVLTFVANQAGGSHFAPKWPKALSDLLLGKVFGHSPLANMLVQVGIATQLLGAALLKRLGDIEVELLLIVPPQTMTANGFVWDARYTESTGRMYCFLDPMKRLHVGVVGIHGGEARIISQELIDWSIPHLVMFSVVTNDDLTTTLRLNVDGELVSEGRSEALLFAHSAREHYVVFLNGTGEPDSGGLHMGIGAITMHRADLSALERAERLLMRAAQVQDAAQQYVTFEPHYRTEIAPGTDKPSAADGILFKSARDLLGDYMLQADASE